jgi:holo-[acyl-carrier protein] synthase
MLFHDAVIERRTGHPPQVEVHGTVAAVAAEKGVRNFHLSLSHDGGVATAMVIAEG